MASYRGSQGSLSLGGNVVAEVKSWEADVERPVLDTTALGDTAETKDIDIPRWSGRFTAQLDYSDTAQAAVVDQIVAGTNASVLAFEGRVSSTTKKMTGNVLINRASVTTSLGSIVMLSCDFVGSGAAAIAWS